MLVFMAKLLLSTLRWVPMCQGFSHFSGFLHRFMLAKLATSSMRVDIHDHIAIHSTISLFFYGIYFIQHIFKWTIFSCDFQIPSSLALVLVTPAVYQRLHIKSFNLYQGSLSFMMLRCCRPATTSWCCCCCPLVGVHLDNMCSVPKTLSHILSGKAMGTENSPHGQGMSSEKLVRMWWLYKPILSALCHKLWHNDDPKSSTYPC